MDDDRSASGDGFVNSLRSSLKYALPWLPKGALHQNKIQPSATVGESLTTTANGAEWQPGLQSLLSTRGQIITRGASAPQALTLGAAGTVLTSDGTDAVWSRDGQLVSGGRLIKTTTWTTGALAVSTNSASLFSITVTGDNVNAMEIRVDANYLASAAFPFMFMLWDGTVGSGTCIGADWQQPPVVSTRASTHVVGQLSAFSGSKTINFAVQTSTAGGMTVSADAAAIAADRPARMTAKWIAP